MNRLVLLVAACALGLVAACSNRALQHGPSPTGGTATAGAGAAGTHAAGTGAAGAGAGMGGGGSGGAGAAGGAAAVPAQDASADGQDGPLTVVPSRCKITPYPVGSLPLCAGAQPCPVTTVVELFCDRGGTGRISLAPRADGASVLLDVRGTPDDVGAELLTIVSAGGSYVESLRGIVNTKLVADLAGVRNIFAGTKHGGRRFRETTSGWVREDLAPQPGLDFPSLIDARVIDDEHAAVALGGGGGVSLGVRDEDGWKFSMMADLQPSETGLAMDVSLDGRPWLVTVGYHEVLGEQMHVEVRSPDGKFETLSPFNDFDVLWRTPALLARGLTGTDKRPAIAYKLADGIHLATPKADDGWAQRLVPDTRLSAQLSNACPAEGDVLLNCGIATCEGHIKETEMGLAMATTAGGATFLAWVERDAIQTIALVRDPTCGVGAQGCICRTGSEISRQGPVSLVVARVPGDPGAAFTLRRFPLDGAGTGMGTIAVAARGNTLLAAVLITQSDTAADVQYLEIDATKLP